MLCRARIVLDRCQGLGEDVLGVCLHGSFPHRAQQFGVGAYQSPACGLQFCPGLAQFLFQLGDRVQGLCVVGFCVVDGALCGGGFGESAGFAGGCFLSCGGCLGPGLAGRFLRRVCRVAGGFGVAAFVLEFLAGVLGVLHGPGERFLGQGQAFQQISLALLPLSVILGGVLLDGQGLFTQLFVGVLEPVQAVDGRFEVLARLVLAGTNEFKGAGTGLQFLLRQGQGTVGGEQSQPSVGKAKQRGALVRLQYLDLLEQAVGLRAGCVPLVDDVVGLGDVRAPAAQRRPVQPPQLLDSLRAHRQAAVLEELQQIQHHIPCGDQGARDHALH
ncbi:hypothetical protein B0675_39270 [Streptomyces sp. M41(2017)]|nr:hypothetical protein B0675_39270 [Streptomyces sp. M41(2017)]